MADPDFTAGEILEASPGGFGPALDAVLHLDRAEKDRIARAIAEKY